MLNILMNRYMEMFNETITLIPFISLTEEEQIDVLKHCIKDKQPLYRSKYFIDNYIEQLED